uniref:Uncharacterized protein n=1 Tax=Glossina austeni TaxID=7395 RepID=A0A1A9V1S8_GLOAU
MMGHMGMRTDSYSKELQKKALDCIQKTATASHKVERSNTSNLIPSSRQQSNVTSRIKRVTVTSNYLAFTLFLQKRLFLDVYANRKEAKAKSMPNKDENLEIKFLAGTVLVVIEEEPCPTTRL